jgi:hypothetical protein
LDNTTDSNESNDINSLNLGRVVFIGRTFLEYVDMFGLELQKIKGLRILDCPSGASSFVCESFREHGMKFVTGCDVMYKSRDLSTLENIATIDLIHMAAKLSETSSYYKWEQYHDIKGLLKARKLPLQKFLTDYNSGIREKRYVYAKLPKLPFRDKEFDLVLSGNLLFYYHDVLDYDFHLQSILEFIRVSAKEVRIFPIVTPNGKLPTYFERLMRDLRRLTTISLRYEITDVKYHFRKGVNKMMLLNRYD